ncbi:F-actin-monooxygenase Mical-like [Musca vetustissima]|uniref:F-actin-monooxygenase Mical-like n=1 Tax=Musca vetustissima TaxID=27455 RepID=UPI002AB7B07D|nr:F-actin-monooxygenase Mical-like [Musca vetustissima]
MELLERGQTPERIEFENTDAISDGGEPSEEHIIDEHEWSGRNFLPESNNDSESDLTSSDESDTESDDDMYEEANESPLGAQTLQLASEWIGKQNYSDSDDSDDFYDSSEGLADDGKDDTEGEEFAKARELRREEVRLPPLPPNLPTDTETEVQSDTETSTSDELEHNSATEISTDSEFDNDELIRSAPKIFIDDTHLRKPTKVQVKSTVIPPNTIQKYNSGSNIPQYGGRGGMGSATGIGTSGPYLAKYQTPQQQQQQLQQQNTPQIPQFKPLVQVDPSLLSSNRTPLQNPRPGDYLLNKTASTEGIASKKSLELKKRYLLGEPANGNKIQKSGSTSVLDSRIRSFQSNISECQKLLNPSNEISPSMKTFLDRTKLGEKPQNEALMRSATNNILNDLKVEITIQKASSTASTDNEKENVYVNNKNELNKCMEYTETVNAALLDTMAGKKTPASPNTTPTNNKSILETIDLTTPEKQVERDKSDSNKVIDLTGDSPEQKSNRTILEENEIKPPDVSKDVKQVIPDILGHIGERISPTSTNMGDKTPTQQDDHSMEKEDVPEKEILLQQEEDNEVEDVQIEVPNIEWNTHKEEDNLSCSSSNSSCSSHSSSLEDIEHFILESTTSPETHNSAIAMVSTGSGGANHQVPRLEVHDTSGTLMQIDSLMIIDGKYIGDPEDLKYMELPEGVTLPEEAAVKTIELEPEDEKEHEVETEHEPVTATPEPVETTVIEVGGKTKQLEETESEAEAIPPPLPETGPPLPEKGPPKVKPSMLKFDSKNENKIESLKNLPLILDSGTVDPVKAIKPISLNLSNAQKSIESPVGSPLIDMDKTPTGDLLSRGSDSETEPTGTAQILTETELSDWTADDCISENFVELDYDRSSRRNKSDKKSKRKGNAVESSRLPSTNEVMQELAKAVAPVAEFEGILKSIDLDDIEFMDTGSEDESSGTEAHSATNTALLRNRGYMEFVDQQQQETTPKHVAAKQPLDISKPISVKRDERLGVDYIEQGAYIMHHEDANKTPVNETSKNVMTQSLTDSSTFNDLEDDSGHSQIQLSTTTTTSASSRQGNKSANINNFTTPTTTTEESEALTVVSSPLDSSPHTRNSTNSHRRDYVGGGDSGGGGGSGSTPSSTDRAPKSSQSTSGTNSATTSSKNTTPPRQLSKDSPSLGPLAPGDRRSHDELSYEEYVRALQQKIVQISSTARGDSLEAKKQRRKSSKGEMSLNQISVIDNNTTTTTTPSNLRFDSNNTTTTHTSDEQKTTTTTDNTHAGSTQQTAQKKVPEIPTLTSKLEEITKERTKQKDLIHDLVMDKLQSKKQLNAEKRLHRSRQRSIMTSGLGGGAGGCGYSSGSSLSPTPKLAAANSTTDTNCTNQAHYHVSTASQNPTSPSARTAAATQRFLNNSSSFKENNPLETTTSYVSPYSSGIGGGGLEPLSPIRSAGYKIPRPFSEHLEDERLKNLEQRYKINKTPSFSYVSAQKSTTTTTPPQPMGSSTPIPPLRQNRGRQQGNNNNNNTNNNNVEGKDANITTSTENLRSEARARARLKSNSELGLSPEEKMQLLRKRIQNEYSSSGANKQTTNPQGYERPTSLRDSKMNTSKSVNDLAYQMSISGGAAQLSDNLKSHVKNDFTSDPNILLSTKQQQLQQQQQQEKPTKKLNRRAKDPERRKSLIQSLSNFFHMGQHANKENKTQHNTGAASDVNSAQAEQTGTGGVGSGSNNSTPTTTTSSTPSSGIDGVLSRFRISPKSKEKSRDKDKDDYSCYTDSPTRRLRTSSMSMAALACYDCPRQQQQQHHYHHQHSSSQDALTRSHFTTAETPTHHYSHNQLNNLNSSSPQKAKITTSNNCLHLQRLHHSGPQQLQQQRNKELRSSGSHSHHITTSPPAKKSSSSSALAFTSSNPQLCVHKSQSMTNASSHNAAAASRTSPNAYDDDQIPPPIPPLPLNYQRSDDESYTNETRDQKKQRAISKAVRQAELKRLRIAQEIQREQEEIEVQLKELETRGVLIEKALRGEEQTVENLEPGNNIGSNDEKLLKELLEIWRNITQLKKRDEELGIRQQELQLEHRHAQLKEELNMRLSCNKLDKSSADVAAEGAILNEMLEIVAKRAALRPSSSTHDLAVTTDLLRGASSSGGGVGDMASGSGSSKIQLSTSSRGQSNDNEESNI